MEYKETKRRRKQRIKDKRIATRMFWRKLRQRIEGKGNDTP